MTREQAINESAIRFSRDFPTAYLYGEFFLKYSANGIVRITNPEDPEDYYQALLAAYGLAVLEHTPVRPEPRNWLREYWNRMRGILKG